MGKFDESFSWIERLIPCLVIFLITTRVIVIRPGGEWLEMVCYVSNCSPFSFFLLDHLSIIQFEL